MHLLIVSHSCATPLNQQIYAEIQRQTGWKVTLVVPKDWKDEFGNRLKPKLWEEFEADLVAMPVALNGRIIEHFYLGSFQKLIRERGVDVVYVNHEPYALATWQVARGCVKSAIPFGVYSCQNIWKRYPAPFSWMERFVYRHAAFAFPITTDVDAVIKAKGFKGHSKIAPLPLDPDLYRPNKDGECPNSLNFKRPPFVIGYVGRMIEAKGLKTLAKALAQLKELDWKLCLIGKGDYLSTFIEILENEGLKKQVIQTGYVPHSETPRYLAAMDLLVLPSETQPNWKEQFGRVIPEAMACGTPVVGSDSGEIPYLIQQSKGGLVFPETNAEALAATMAKVITNKEVREDIASRGRSWVAAKLSVKTVAAEMANTIETCFEKGIHE